MVRGPLSTDFRRALFLIACLLPAWAAAVALTGGMGWRAGRWNLSSHDPLRPLLIGAVVAFVYWQEFSKPHLPEDHDWLARWSEKLAAPGALALSGAILLTGVLWGTFVAGGSDSYGYVSQADLWLKGALRVSQPWVREMPWPLADWTFAPLGYRPATVPGAIVPAYSPGLPLLMAAFKLVLGSRGPFLVVPVCGALAVWLTYLLGRDATGEARVGVLAALLMATSPAFLFQLMSPMSDVPVTAWWTLMFWLGCRPANRRPMAAGFAAGAAVLTRPNLAPLALVLPAVWLWSALRLTGVRRDAWRAVNRFAVGLAPGLLAGGAINAYLYGSALASGYGDLGDLYSAANVLTNARRYGAWLLQTQTPVVGLALIAIVAPGALHGGDRAQGSRRWAFVGGIVVVTLSYLFYAQFEDWSYLRFLLPSFPLLFVLVAASVAWTWQRVPLRLRAFLAFVTLLPLTAYEANMAVERQAFNLKTFEQRYVTAARFVAGATPVNAMVLSMQHSGSLRYYADRVTLRYDLLSPQWLDRALAGVRDKGYRPYIVLDDWEESAFRERFGAFSAVGNLDWKPRAEFQGPVRVRVFDPDDRTGGEIRPAP
jgi:hypothetical protein